MKTSKKSRKLPGIRGRILVAFLLFSAAAILILALCQTVFFKSFYRRICVNNLEKSSGEIIEAVVKDAREGSVMLTGAKAKSAELSDKYSFCAFLYHHDSGADYPACSFDLTERKIAGCSITDFTLTNFKMLDEVAEEKNCGVFTIIFDEEKGIFRCLPYSDSTPDGTHSVVFLRSFTIGSERYTIYLNSVMTPVGTTVTALGLMLGALSVLLLIAATLLALYLSKKIADPICKTAEAAGTLSNGAFDADFSACAGKRPYREIKELTETLDKAEAELGKTETLRRELIANVSHDLRTPLTLISGYSEMMRDFPDEVNSENLQTIVDECGRLSSLVEDMLEISKLQSGTLTLDKESFDPGVEIEAGVGNYNRLLSHEGYKIHFERDPGESAEIVADKRLVMQAFYNLLNNALTYTGSDHAVFVSEIVKENAVRVEVRDTGAGIPKEDLPTIWERYYKVDSEHKRSARGTGLGLSIVRNVVDLHGGKYGVRSKLGAGSTFWFEIPKER